jgi:gluconokinase
MKPVALSRAERPLVLALDVGTSSCRALLYDARARRVDGVGSQLTYEPRITADGGAEFDPDVLVEQVGQFVDAAVEQGGSALDGLAAVATSTFWHSLMGVDERGRAVTPLYLWMDARSRDAAEDLKRRLDERAVHARTGCVLHWTYWPAKLLWLSRTEPHRFGRVRRWLSFGEYLDLRLYGQAGVSVSMASGTGLLNQHTCDWDDGVLAALPIERDQLSPIGKSKVQAPRSNAGPWTDRWPTLRDVPWLPAVGDGACSNIGAGCTTRERLALMVGTSGALRALWRAESFTIPWGVWGYRADARRVVMGGALNDGGSLLDWLRETLRLPPLEEAERRVGALEPDAHGLTVLPLWAGERSPGWASDARGAIAGLRLHTTSLEMLRAALEAVALYFARIEAILGRAVPEAREVIATGGALLHSPAWLQIMADVLGRPVLASAEPEASSRGAALLALEALGALPDGIEALVPETERVYQPVSAHTERYRAAAERQARLYEALVGPTRSR